MLHFFWRTLYLCSVFVWTEYRGYGELFFSGVLLGEEIFTALDFVDDAVIFTDMMGELTLFLDALARESASALRFWDFVYREWVGYRPKIQQILHTVNQICDKANCRGDTMESIPVYARSRISSDESIQYCTT